MSRILLNEQKTDITLYRKDGSAANFHITKCIGKGSSCVVYHAKDGNTEHLLKEYYPRNLDIERDDDGMLSVPEIRKKDFDFGLLRFRRGCECQKELRLEEKLKNYTSNVQGDFYGNGTEYIDMTCFAGCTYEQVEETSLYDLVRRMKTLAQVIGYYHEAGLLHLDIKPQNIYVRPAGETVEDVMLFDFDSVVQKRDVMISPTLSYTKEWGAPEQLLAHRRHEICEATDIYAIGEILFTKIFGRHTKDFERRSFFKYRFDRKAAIFKNVNPKVFSPLGELLHRTVCGVVETRYQNTAELIAKLDEIIALSNPKEPYLKTSLPAVSGFFTGREKEIQEIHDCLKENDIVFLSGIGGIGKSELAKHFAYQYEKEYDAIIFAPFVNDIKMMIADDTFVPICNFSQYPEEKPEEYFARKMRKLAELCDKRILMIVDNLDTTEDPNMDHLFRLGCKMLVTTRMDFSDVYPEMQLNLGVLENPLEVFHEYYKKPVSYEEQKSVDEIIDIVCGHTMTVELLAKQMMAGRVKPQKMLEKLKNGGIGESGKEKVRTAKDGNLAIPKLEIYIPVQIISKKQWKYLRQFLIIRSKYTEKLLFQLQ